MQFEIVKAGSYVEDMPGSDRVSWPWRNMSVGDKVTIPEHLVKKAQTGVHVYGYQRGWAFRTRKQPDGTLTVWRVE